MSDKALSIVVLCCLVGAQLGMFVLDLQVIHLPWWLVIWPCWCMLFVLGVGYFYSWWLDRMERLERNIWDSRYDHLDQG